MSESWIKTTERQIHNIQLEIQSIADAYDKVGQALAKKDEELVHWKWVYRMFTEAAASHPQD